MCDLDSFSLLARFSLHASFAQSLSGRARIRLERKGEGRKKKRNEGESLDARSLFVFPVGIRVR